MHRLWEASRVGKIWVKPYWVRKFNLPKRVSEKDVSDKGNEIWAFENI